MRGRRGPIDRNHQELIVEALADCRAIGESDSRGYVLEGLGSEIGNGVGGRDGSPSAFARSILAACMRFPAGLDQLLDAVRSIEGDSIAMGELDLAVSVARNTSGLRTETWRRLFDITAMPIPVDPNTVRRIWREVFSELGFREPTSVAQAARFLPQFQAAKFFEFLGRLSVLLSSPNPLTAWMDSASSELGLRAELAEIRRRLKRAPESTLLIQLYPTPFWGSRFIVRAWITRSDDESFPLAATESGRSETETMQSLPELVRDLVTQARARAGRLTVAFMVPHYLITHKYDEWKADFGFVESEIGHDHPVIVYSLDRALKPDLEARWRAKWEHAVTTGRNGELRPAWINRHDTAENLFTMLERDVEGGWQSRGQHDRDGLYGKLAEDDAGSVVLLAVHYADENVIHRLFDTLISAGTPIVLWLRCNHPHPGEATEPLSSLIALTDPTALPEAVRRVRKAASEAKPGRHHPGHHLTLLYEDPARIPSSLVLKAPSTGGRS